MTSNSMYRCENSFSDQQNTIASNPHKNKGSSNTPKKIAITPTTSKSSDRCLLTGRDA